MKSLEWDAKVVPLLMRCGKAIAGWKLSLRTAGTTKGDVMAESSEFLLWARSEVVAGPLTMLGTMFSVACDDIADFDMSPKCQTFRSWSKLSKLSKDTLDLNGASSRYGSHGAKRKPCSYEVCQERPTENTYVSDGVEQADYLV